MQRHPDLVNLSSYSSIPASISYLKKKERGSNEEEDISINVGHRKKPSISSYSNILKQDETVILK